MNRNKRLNPRQRRSVASDRLEMVKRFRESGWTRGEFCRKEEIPLSTLGWWLYQVKQKGEAAADVKFREVRIEPAIAAATSWGMEVVSPKGWTLRGREALTASDMAGLLKRLKC